MTDINDTQAPDPEETRVTIDGKYTVLHTNGANLRAERHGSPWRDLTGDGLILAMAQEIEELRARHAALHAKGATSFEAAWKAMEAAGYQYGDDALEQVRLGWTLAQERVADAFRAGWKINAVAAGENTPTQDYIDGCMEVDLQTYLGQEPPALPQPGALEVSQDLLTYLLQYDTHNRTTPRLIDIAYTAFMQAKRPNREDGKDSDWFTDTKPIIVKLIDQIRAALAVEAGRLVTHRMDGTPRDARDIASDPEGKLIHDPAKPLQPAYRIQEGWERAGRTQGYDIVASDTGRLAASAPVADESAQDVDLPWLRAYMHHQIASDRWVVTAEQAKDFARAAVLADRKARAALASAPVADERAAISGVTLDGCLETLFCVGEHLGINYAESRKQPGAPSGVYIKAIEDRVSRASNAAREEAAKLMEQTSRSSGAALIRTLASAPVAGEALNWRHSTTGYKLYDKSGKVIDPGKTALYAAPQASAENLRNAALEAARDAPASTTDADDTARGLYTKYIVQRRDGSDLPGRKHHGCKCFVLDVDHDKYANVALMAYAAACAGEYPLLARDISEQYGASHPEALQNTLGGLIERLQYHASDKRNTAFSRSTMSEVSALLVLLHSDAVLIDAIDTSWELSHVWEGDDIVYWAVHQRQGALNDREYIVVGKGDTVRAALRDAVRTLKKEGV